MVAPLRLPAAVDANGKARTVTAIPIARVRFSPEIVKDPVKLEKQLEAFTKSVDDATRHARTNVAARTVDFEDVPCPSGGSKVYIRHGLGRFVRWRVVDWAGNGTTDGHKLVCDRLDPSNVETSTTVLALRSYVAGTATIQLYEVP